MSVRPSDIDLIFENAKGKFLLLLLVETKESSPSPKPGVAALGQRVIEEVTARDGALDLQLQRFASERPSRVVYHRLEIDRKDKEVLTRVGVCWFPQVRLMKRRSNLFRSSVSIGDNGAFLAQHVGGLSIRQSSQGEGEYTNLLDALSAEVDKGK